MKQLFPQSASSGTPGSGDGGLGGRPTHGVGSPSAEQEIREAAAPAQPEQAVPAPVVVARRATPEEKEWAGVAAAPAPLPPPAATAPKAQEALRPAPRPDSDIPWWLSETYRQPPAPAAEILWQPAKTRQSRGASAQDAQQPAPGESSGAAASRLSGLRNIFFSRGVDDLHRARKAIAKDEETVSPQIEPRLAAEPQRPAFSSVFVPFPEPAPAVGASSRDGFAAAEFLRPKPAARAMGKRHAWKNEPPVCLDRRQAYDEVAILPSWRGQYRRKD